MAELTKPARIWPLLFRVYDIEEKNMTRLTITTALIATATSAMAHPGHSHANNGVETWMVVGLVALAVAGIPVLRRALRK